MDTWKESPSDTAISCVVYPRSALVILSPLQEDVLAELLKTSGSGLLSMGRKFGGLDIKRVYFG